MAAVKESQVASAHRPARKAPATCGRGGGRVEAESSFLRLNKKSISKEVICRAYCDRKNPQISSGPVSYSFEEEPHRIYIRTQEWTPRPQGPASFC